MGRIDPDPSASDDQVVTDRKNDFVHGLLATSFTKNIASCRHDGRMPVLTRFLAGLRPLVLTRASGPGTHHPIAYAPGRYGIPLRP